MHSLAARIALLAYVIGGLAIPAMHRHGAVEGASGSQAHVHSTPADAGHTCCHSAEPETDAFGQGRCDTEAAASELATAVALLQADSPHAAACSADCVVCAFAGSAQTPVGSGSAVLASGPQRKLDWIARGPGFTAADLSVDRLRGPPTGVILGEPLATHIS